MHLWAILAYPIFCATLLALWEMWTEPRGDD
jgi:hypothetical protein